MQHERLRKAAQFVRNANPETWRTFVDVFAELTAEVVDKVSEASVAEFPEMKGRAITMKGLLQLFRNPDLPRLP